MWEELSYLFLLICYSVWDWFNFFFLYVCGCILQDKKTADNYICIALQNLVIQHTDHSAGDFIDLLQGLLRYDPGDRLGAREALAHCFFTRS